MSLPALAREFQHVEMTLRTEQPVPPKAGVVLTFSLAQINKLVKETISFSEGVRVKVAGATAAARRTRLGIVAKPIGDFASGIDEIDVAICTDDVIASMDAIITGLESATLRPVAQMLTDAAPKLNNRSSEERRYVRRLAAKVTEADERFVVARERFIAENNLLRSYLRERARFVVSEASKMSEFAARAYEAIPAKNEPDYAALRLSISRRFEKTLARLAE